MESLGNWIDIKTVLGGLVVGLVVALIVGLVGRRKERWKQRLPILKELSCLLEEISTFAGKGTTNTLNLNITTHHGTYTSGNIVIHNGDKVFQNANSCGGPLSWKGISGDSDSLIPKIKVFLKDKFPPYVKLDREEGKLIDIKNSLENFVCCLKEFNKRWPSFPPGSSISQLEHKNRASPFEEALKIESMADLIKRDVIELKSKVDKAMESGWF